LQYPKQQQGDFMNSKFLVITLLALPVLSIAQDELPQAVPIKIETAYIPVGFDNNDKVEMVVEGTLPTTCYRVGPAKVDLNPSNGILTVTQFAYKYKGSCMAMSVKFTNPVTIGFVPPQPFTVRDGTDNGELGKLFVEVAKTSKADDFLYAPITEVTVDVRRREATITGTFTNSCANVKEMKVTRVSHNVVVALPISEIVVDRPCTVGQFPFNRVVKLPFLNDHRYLIHTRSLDGQAVNKLFTIGDPNP
jgi:hypothetical protein